MRPPAFDAQLNQARFFLPGNDFDIRAERSRGAGDKFLLIACIAHGGGGHRADSIYVEPFVLLGHAAEHTADQIHGFLADAAGAEDTGAEACDLPFRRQDAGRFARTHLRGFHSNGVTADIDGCVARHVSSL